MINQYKRHDIFRCSQEAHRRFGGRVSVYHVLKEKACYPQGCIYFLWRCSLMENGHRCVQGYRYVGKPCKGCTYYIEEKVHLQPECLIDSDSYECFKEVFEDFESWLESVRYRRLNIQGKIRKIKPWFEKIILPGENHIRLRGYLLVFSRGYIGLTPFEDTFYVRISERLMKAYRFLPKMKVEMTGEIREDRGRIIIHKPQKVELLNRGWGRSWNRERAVVAVKTSTWFKSQPDQCLECVWGALADVVDRREHQVKKYRNLFCLKGITDPDGCYVKASQQPGCEPLRVGK